jgi:hypothetical protein
MLIFSRLAKYCRKLDQFSYHGTSAATSGWLKTLAALYLLLVGIGSPCGV